MDSDQKRTLHIFGWAALLAAILQTIGLIRYVGRLPEDWIAITLYVVTILAFVAGSISAFIRAGKDET